MHYEVQRAATESTWEIVSKHRLGAAARKAAAKAARAWHREKHGTTRGDLAYLSADSFRVVKMLAGCRVGDAERVQIDIH